MLIHDFFLSILIVSLYTANSPSKMHPLLTHWPNQYEGAFDDTAPSQCFLNQRLAVKSPMNFHLIFRAVFSTLGEYLDTLPSLAGANVYLTEFNINSVLNAHSGMAEGKVVFDAGRFHPMLPPDFDLWLWLHSCKYPLSTQGPTSKG